MGRGESNTKRKLSQPNHYAIDDYANDADDNAVADDDCTLIVYNVRRLRTVLLQFQHCDTNNSEYSNAADLSYAAADDADLSYSGDDDDDAVGNNGDDAGHEHGDDDGGADCDDNDKIAACS